MAKKVLNALVTGAGRGIGADIAKELAKKNIHIIITDKSLSGLKKTHDSIVKNNGSCTIAELDMQDFKGIDRLGMEVYKRWGKLDFLISNAAVLGTLGPIHHQVSDEFIEVINVNSISNHRLIRSFDVLLKNSIKPCAIFLSSSLVSKPKPFWGAYAVSKATLEHIVKIWALENKHNNLSILIIDPGKTDTKMRKMAMPGENTKNLKKSVDVARSIVNIILSKRIYKGDVIKINSI